MLEETSLQHTRISAMTYSAETWTFITQTKNKTAAAQANMERSMLNITYRHRKTNIWVGEKTKATDVIEQVKKRKWTWAGHVSRIRDNRWRLRIATWKPYERKRHRGRPVRLWRDELDDHWKSTIWQRIAQCSGSSMIRPSPNNGTLWLHNDE